MTMTHYGTGEFEDGFDPFLAGPEFKKLTCKMTVQPGVVSHVNI